MASIQDAKINLDAASVKNQHIAPNAALDASKLQHVYKHGTDFGLKIGDTPVNAERTVFVASGAGTVSGFSALLTAVGTGTSIAFTLKKNGTSILTSDIVITNGSNTDRQVVPALISSAAFAAGDVFTIEETVSTSTGAQGPYAFASFVENTSP
jgi:hypothetical protein